MVKKKKKEIPKMRVTPKDYVSPLVRKEKEKKETEQRVAKTRTGHHGAFDIAKKITDIDKAKASSGGERITPEVEAHYRKLQAQRGKGKKEDKKSFLQEGIEKSEGMGEETEIQKKRFMEHAKFFLEPIDPEKVTAPPFPIVPGVGSASAIGRNLKNVVKATSKAQKILEKSKAISRIQNIFKINNAQATKYYEAGGKIKPSGLMERARDLGIKKGLAIGGGISAVGLFVGTWQTQAMVFWSGVDNVAGAASLDALKLLDEVNNKKWLGEGEGITPEEIQTEIDRINSTLNFAQDSINTATWLNPVTGWAIGRYYKGVLKRTQESVNYKFDAIARSQEKLKGGK